MAKKNQHINQLVRNGTTQDQRFPEALDSNYVALMDHSTEDYLKWVQQYSRYIDFPNINQQNIKWSTFFKDEPLLIFSNLANLPIEEAIELYRKLPSYIYGRSEITVLDKEHIAQNFKLLFFLPFGLVNNVMGLLQSLEKNHPERIQILDLLETEVNEPLIRLADYLESGKNIKPNLLNFDPLSIQGNSELIPFLSNEIWEITKVVDANVISIYNIKSLNNSDKPFQTNEVEFKEQIFDILNYNLLTLNFEGVLQGLQKVVLLSKTILSEQLNDCSNLPAHLGLFVAFTQLLKDNQDQFNQLTTRNVNYYYEHILQLTRRQTEANKVHLLLKLIDEESELIIKKETELSAGRDSAGQEMLYEIEEDLIVNQAKIEAIQSFRKYNGEFLASTITNSLDGKGEKLPRTKLGWNPFGPEIADKAKVGFTISDANLFLSEGARTIHLILEGGSLRNQFDETFEAQITTEEGWMPVNLSILSDRFVAEMNPSFPRVVAFSTDLHEEGLDKGLPELKILLKDASRYDALQNIRLTDLSIEVFVNGIKNISLQNEFGSLDSAKPFLPFGANPEKGSYLIIGNYEFFGKEIAKHKISLEWDENGRTNLPSGLSDKYNTDVAELKEGKWENKGQKKLFQLSGNSTTVYENYTGPGTAGNNNTSDSEEPFIFYSPEAYLYFMSSKERNFEFQGLHNEGNLLKFEELFEDFSPSSNNGFLKIELVEADPFGHESYRENFTNFLIKKGRGVSDSVNQKPIEPYTPKAKNISLAYETKVKIPDYFVHIHPFGIDEKNWEETPTISLLPDYSNEGELYIGLSNLNAPETVSILFQIEEGTSSQDKSLNENDINWSYLANNQWYPFPNEQVEDTTFLFKQSGIIRFAFGQGEFPVINDSNSLLTGNRVWIRMHVKENSDALPDFVFIEAQAVKARLKLDGYDAPDDLITDGLAPETITDFVETNNSIDSILQPFSSFGGRLKEEDKQFHTRVSERLRHKDRAVQIWDYERLILENFPDLYRAKCINHTSFAGNRENSFDPGAITFVLVAKTNNNQKQWSSNRLVDKITLELVRRFLKQRMSPFIRMEVRNPIFETVKLSFSVAFKDEIKDVRFYKNQLNDELIKLITPWAFAQGRDIDFQGKWYKSTFINFIEEKPYVNYLKEFKMYHSDSGQDRDIVEGSTSVSILIGHLSNEINVIPNEVNVAQT